MVYRNLLFFFYMIIGQVLLYGQDEKPSELPRKMQEAGYPLIQNYTPDNYGAFTQNWGVVQDSLGILYFCNGDGVLCFDGVNWEVIGLPNRSHPKSIAVDKNNRVYVGASGEFGYLEPDSIGSMKYVSLSSLLDEQDQEFTTVWEIHTTEEGVYFRSADALFRWDGKSFTIWEGQGESADLSFFVNDTLYLSKWGKGLGYLETNTFKLIPNGDFFTDKRVRAIFPYGKDRLLIGTLDSFFIYGNDEIVAFETDVDGFIEQNKLYSGLRLKDGSFALASVKGGMAVIDNKGRKLLLLDNEKTLTSLITQSLFQDRSGILWVALGNGISKVEFPSPFTHYDQLGITNTCYAVKRYKNVIYAGTRNGLFRLQTDKNERAHFEIVKGFKDRIWDLLIFRDRLLIAGEDGVYQIHDGELSTIGNWNPSAFHRSNLDPNRIFISLADGLGSIYYENGIWKDEGLIEGVRGSTYTIIEETSGNLWLETSQDWLWKVSFDEMEKALKLEEPKAEKFGSSQGLPGDTGNLYKVKNTVYFVSDHGRETYEFDKINKVFKPDSTLNEAMGLAGKNIFINHVDYDGNVFFSMDNTSDIPKHLVGWKMLNGAYNVRDLNEERISDKIGWSMFVELKDSIIWHGGERGIVRHDLAFPKKDKNRIKTLIKKVAYQGDSLLLAGAYNLTNTVLPFKNNSFRFLYASPSFYQEEKNEFQHSLEGFDEDWSKWTLEARKDYTNLPEGDYTFKVRAKNIFGETGEVDSYSFTILPPWYRSWWAYLLYLAVSIASLSLLLQWRSQQMRKKNLALEGMVKERTSEIIQKNRQLERQTDQLQEQTEQLKVVDKMKTRLFANISHEFRTPLTLIKGPIEKLEESKQTTISTSNIKMIRRNANRLIKLVNQLLDLSKLDAGNLQLEPSEGNMYKCLRAAASSFSSHAAQRNMDYDIKIPSRTLWASFDRDKLEKVVYNLLSNAFKFSSDNATIVISAGFVQGSLEIKVADTGYGIPSDRLPEIFDRFFQVDDSFTKEKEGTGIGLALTKELVDLMGGNIRVESEYQKGSIFMVTIPIEEIKTSQKEDSETLSEVFAPEVESATTEASKKQKNKEVSTVLIIEDHSDMRDFIKQQLVEEYQIIEAYNGKDGLEKAKENTPNLIVTDLMMPQMDGITLCKKLKKDIHTCHIPIIMLTAKAGLENKLEGLETGADAYLTKPFNVKELQVRARNLIEQRQKLRELFTKSQRIHPREVTATSLDEQFLQKTLELLEERYSDPDFGILQMQEHLAMSRAQLHRKIKAITDQASGELLRNFRLKRAAQILEQQGENVTQVAYMVGFNNLSYFAKCFREFYGVAPSRFHKDNKRS